METYTSPPALKILLLVFLGSIVFSEMIYAATIHLNSFRFLFCRIGLLLALMTVVNTKNKVTYFLGMAIALFGIYDTVLGGPSEFTPALSDFTSTFLVFLKGSSQTLKHLIILFPTVFFFAMMIILSLPKVRAWYGLKQRIIPKPSH